MIYNNNNSNRIYAYTMLNKFIIKMYNDPRLKYTWNHYTPNNKVVDMYIHIQLLLSSLLYIMNDYP